jgi:Ca2+-transporting ATPase
MDQKPIGLTSAIAAQRLKEQGPNEIAAQGPRGYGQIVRDVLTEPMFLLLLIAATIYVVLGELRES